MVSQISRSPTADSIEADHDVRTKKLHDIALAWFSVNGRVFPWRSTRDPYQILVAEVCLQKTNAEKVVMIFDQIIDKYPNITSLAAAKAEDMREHFSRLGLFKRSNFLLQIAKTFVDRYDGIIPCDREALLMVKGIGDYTANSVLSLAYGERLPMLDGSTQRVLARIFNKSIDKPAWANRTMRHFMYTILPDSGAREFNLALIDIADKFCRPKKPKCSGCPLISVCLAATELGRI